MAAAGKPPNVRRPTIAELEAELARRTAERDEALAQQAATTEVLSIINASPGDVTPAFETMLEKAKKLCDAEFGLLQLYDSGSGGFRFVAGQDLPPAVIDYLRQRETSGNPIRPLPGGIFGPLIAGEASIQIPDIGTWDRYHSGSAPMHRVFHELGRARTWLTVALRKDGALTGVLSIYRREVRSFSDRHLALLRNFAAQAEIAIENARLLTETKEALEQQTATAEVLQVINSSPGDLAPVFDAILQKAHTLCEAAHGHLTIFDGDCFRVVAMQGINAVAPPLAQPFSPEPGSLQERMLQGERLIHIADIAVDTTPPGNVRRRTAVEAGFHTVIFIPLRRDDVLIGYITAYRREVRPFTEKQIALLQNFAAQAVIAMENARLLTETREALERQTATSDILRTIAAGDADATLRKIAETSLRLFGAVGASFRTAEGDEFKWSVSVGAGAAQVGAALWDDEAKRPTVGGRNLPGTVVRENRQIHLADLDRLDPGIADWPGPPVARSAGIRTMIGTPLRTESRAIGALTVYRDVLRPFEPIERQLLQSFADQAAVAIENARLMAETRDALEQQTATAEVLGVINSSPGDLAPVWKAMLEKALRLCGATFGMMNTYDGERFHRAADIGVPPAYAEYRRNTPPTTYAPETGPSRIVAGEDVVQNVDLKAEEIYERGDPNRRALVDLGGGRSHLAVALRKDDRLLGHLAVYRQEVRPFNDKQIALLQNFAAQAVIAMENARLLGELRQRTEEVAELNRGLETRVAEQVEELGRVGRLKRFLAPQLAELIVSQGDEKILESHRREIVVVFCDLRGYTAFTETAEPEEVLDFLREYHGALGPLVSQFEGTLDQFSGDGIMVFFNDPVPIPDPAERAVKMAVAMREAAGTLITDWRERGRDLGFGAGIAQGYATLGQIGFSERSGYTAIGTVCNVAARLCAEAKDGQILLSQRVNVALKGSIATEQLGALALKGLTQPVIAYNVPLTAAQPILRVIEGGPPTE